MTQPAENERSEMAEYRIITNGEKFKAQIKETFLCIPYWATLQRNYNKHTIPLIMRDTIYSSYEEAEKDVKKYIENLKKNKEWWPATK